MTDHVHVRLTPGPPYSKAAVKTAHAAAIRRRPRIALAVVCLFSTLFQSCISFPESVRLEPGEGASFATIEARIVPGLPGTVVVSFTNTGFSSAVVDLHPAAPVIGTASEERIEHVGEITEEVCTGSVCVPRKRPIYVLRSESKSIEGAITVSPRKVVLAAGETASVAIRIENLHESNIDFHLRVRCVLRSDEEKRSVVLVIGNDVFSSVFF